MKQYVVIIRILLIEGEVLKMKFIFLVIICLLLVFLIDKTIKKLLKIETEKISETPGKNIDRWGRGIILVAFLIALPIVSTKDSSVTIWFWTIYLVLLLGFQAILEWRYLKNSKQYVGTLILLFIGLILFSNAESIFNLFY